MADSFPTTLGGGLGAALLLVAGVAPADPVATALPDGKLVIAHRGASGYLPEHTLAAYAMAIAMGVDFIEPDLVATRDGVLISRHDLTLEGTTDVAERFPQRAREDGHWYAADFDLAEIRALAARSPRPGRFEGKTRGFGVPTFDEILELLRELNRLRGTRVGVAPELKAPAWHRAAELPLEERAIASLERFGFGAGGAPILIQSFEEESLQRVRASTQGRWPVLQLLEDDEGHDRFTSEAGLRELARSVTAIGPSKRRLARNPGLVARAQARGLRVIVYTLRADDDFAPGESFEGELRWLFDEVGVDGVFTDHPDRARALRDEWFPPSAADLR